MKKLYKLYLVLLVMLIALFSFLCLKVEASDTIEEKTYTCAYDSNNDGTIDEVLETLIIKTYSQTYVRISYDNINWILLPYNKLDDYTIELIFEDDVVTFKTDGDKTLNETSILIYHPELDRNITDNDIPSESQSPSEWFKTTIMPYLLTALSGLTGSSIVGFLLVLLIKKLKKKTCDVIADAISSLNISNDAIRKINKSVENGCVIIESTANKCMDLIIKKVQETVQKTINDNLKEFKISAEEITNSRERQAELTKAICMALDVTDNENEE